MPSECEATWGEVTHGKKCHGDGLPVQPGQRLGSGVPLILPCPVLHRIFGNQTFIPGLKIPPRFGEVFWVRCPKNINEGILRFSFQANAEPYLE